MKRVIAALTFFTRLPLWRFVELEKKHYERVVPLWPLVGWVTGATMAVAFWLSNLILPVTVSVIIAIIARILLTGALHEDGFADFCDGFGGGTSRERTLEIMKDSHIGTYGVLGLVLYSLLAISVLTELVFVVDNVFALFIAADSLAKMLSSTIIYFLPYARKESEAKTRLVYSHVPWYEKLLTLALGIAPFALISAELLIPYLVALAVAVLTCAFLFTLMHRTIKGYTGDCCGATFVIVEIVVYLTLLAIINLN